MFGKRQYGTKPAHQGRFRESLAARRLQARTRVFSQTYFAERPLIHKMSFTILSFRNTMSTSEYIESSPNRPFWSPINCIIEIIIQVGLQDLMEVLPR